jgi:uncharacterized protein YbbC (DUF1343 family)
MFYHHSVNKQDVFFDTNFNYHAGNEELKQQIILSIFPKEIRSSWSKEKEEFLNIRKKYLIYPEF